MVQTLEMDSDKANTPDDTFVDSITLFETHIEPSLTRRTIDLCNPVTGFEVTSIEAVRSRSDQVKQIIASRAIQSV